MKRATVKISPQFRAQTTKAIIAILFFVLTYIILFLLAAGLTAFCIYAGITIIIYKPTFITLATGLGIASLGVLILFFLIKFLFKSNKTDLSHLYEIQQPDHPGLFALIEEIVNSVGTKFPKKVYLSNEVNAAVFYDSNFWSMILPVRKNLQVGLGLVNSVSEDELKAVLAHEFGHFSQKTMKVGSYVYNVNQVIFNLLYDNEGYGKIINSWANISGFFSFFASVAVNIVQAIQWILRKLYSVVNKTYMGLSREMEFHADEIAASITGHEPLKTSLLRLSFADYTYKHVLSFYDSKFSLNQKSKNLYREHSFVLNYVAQYNNIPIVNNLPDVTLDELNKFNKSKLVIKDQWASHPSTEDRIKRLEATGFNAEKINYSPAAGLFENISRLQTELTNNVFANVAYQGEATFLPYEDFKKMFVEQFLKDTFSKVYNSYYDSKNPVIFDLDSVTDNDKQIRLEDLFDNSKVDMVYTAFSLQNDIETLKQIAGNAIELKTVDYDGKKYKRKDINSLVAQLNIESEQLNTAIEQNDKNIYAYFLQAERTKNTSSQLKQLYKDLFDYDKDFDQKHKVFLELNDQLQFISVTTPFEVIVANFQRILPIESRFKEELGKLMHNQDFQEIITKEIRDNYEQYTSAQLVYFSNNQYNDAHLNILSNALNHFTYLLSKGYFTLKKKLLNYQEELIA